jgi:hypothetical protein
MTPSIATKFQYVNSPFFIFSFLLTTCFGPYGPSSGEIYNWCLQGLFLLQRIISYHLNPLTERPPLWSRPVVRPWGCVVLTTQHPLSVGVGTGLDDKRRSVGRYSSLADWGHGVWFFYFFLVLVYLRSRVPDPMRWFLNLPNRSGRARPWGLLSL